MSILETIDNAVQDWETSDDAMRWTPEPPAQWELRITPERVEAFRETFQRAMQPIAVHMRQLGEALAYLKEQVAPVMRETP